MTRKLGFVSRKESSTEVNVAPLLDMVFILLIFLVITTNFTRQTGLDVRKPSAQSAVYQGAKTILIGISPEGSIHIHGKQVGLDAMAQILSNEIKKQADASVVIIADKAANIGRAVEVMDVCLLSGIKKVSVAADKQ
jgi:biopolymer transport protein ExbD